LISSVLALFFRSNKKGTIADESSDGMNLIFAPTSWEEVFVTHPMEVFFYVFENTPVSLPMKVVREFALFKIDRSSALL
jgi:hypothetical protein